MNGNDIKILDSACGIDENRSGKSFLRFAFELWDNQGNPTEKIDALDVSSLPEINFEIPDITDVTVEIGFKTYLDTNYRVLKSFLQKVFEYYDKYDYDAHPDVCPVLVLAVLPMELDAKEYILLLNPTEMYEAEYRDYENGKTIGLKFDNIDFETVVNENDENTNS